MLTSADSTAVQQFVSVVQVLAGRVVGAQPADVPQVFACALDSFPDHLDPTGLVALRYVLTGAACRLELVSAPHRTSSTFSRELIRIQAAVSLQDLRDAFEQYLNGLRHWYEPVPIPNASDARVLAALAYMREHFSRPRLALEDIAATVRLSTWHLDRLFRSHTGRCFKRLLREIRMEEARRLLANPLLSIKEIAAHVGYSHVAEFDRQFNARSSPRRQTGAQDSVPETGQPTAQFANDQQVIHRQTKSVNDSQVIHTDRRWSGNTRPRQWPGTGGSEGLRIRQSRRSDAESAGSGAPAFLGEGT